MRNYFILFFLSQTFLFPHNELGGFKAFFFLSITGFFENLRNILDCLPRKCMFIQNHIQFLRVQDLLKLLVYELQKEIL